MLAKAKYLVNLKSKDLLMIPKKKKPSDSGLPVGHIQPRAEGMRSLGDEGWLLVADAPGSRVPAHGASETPAEKWGSPWLF